MKKFQFESYYTDDEVYDAMDTYEDGTEAPKKEVKSVQLLHLIQGGFF